jgi:hypothetical protein
MFSNRENHFNLKRILAAATNHYDIYLQSTPNPDSLSACYAFCTYRNEETDDIEYYKIGAPLPVLAHFMLFFTKHGIKHHPEGSYIHVNYDGLVTKQLSKDDETELLNTFNTTLGLSDDEIQSHSMKLMQ